MAIGAGRGGDEDQRMGSSSLPRMVLSYSIPAPPHLTPHDGENLLTPSLPLEALRSPAPPRKTLLFIILPYNQYNFFNETYFINKNILEITTKFIPSNQINFQKKLNNISKCLTRQSLKKILKKKKKPHSIIHNKIKQRIKLSRIK